MRRLLLISLALALFLTLGVSIPAFAATTATVTVTATPSFIAISVNPTNYDFGVVAPSATPNETTGYHTVTNTSSVVINVSIGVTSATWTGGSPGWTHSDTAAAGADTVGLKASKNTGAFDVTVKYTSPVNIASAQAATTNFQFEMKLFAPTSFSNGDPKSNTVMLIATAS